MSESYRYLSLHIFVVLHLGRRVCSRRFGLRKYVSNVLLISSKLLCLYSLCELSLWLRTRCKYGRWSRINVLRPFPEPNPLETARRFTFTWRLLFRLEKWIGRLIIFSWLKIGRGARVCRPMVMTSDGLSGDEDFLRRNHTHRIEFYVYPGAASHSAIWTVRSKFGAI